MWLTAFSHYWPCSLANSKARSRFQQGPPEQLTQRWEILLSPTPWPVEKAGRTQDKNTPWGTGGSLHLEITQLPLKPGLPAEEKHINAAESPQMRACKSPRRENEYFEEIPAAVVSSDPFSNEPLPGEISIASPFLQRNQEYPGFSKPHAACVCVCTDI